MRATNVTANGLGGGGLRWGGQWAANGEEHFIKSGIMLNLPPIPHVLQMDVPPPPLYKLRQSPKLIRSLRLL